MFFVRWILILACAAPVSAAPPPAEAASPVKKTVVFLGDSLTAGYGLEIGQAYPALIQRRIDANGWPIATVNAGVSGDTTTGGLNRLDWLLRRDPDIVVIALGANDGLRGIAPEVTRRNLQAIIERARAGRPQRRLLLAGMKLPPNFGAEYNRRFEAVFRAVANKNNVPLLPFLLEGVGGKPAFNLPDGVHPNAEGQKVVAETVWRALQPLLKAALGETPAGKKRS